MELDLILSKKTVPEYCQRFPNVIFGKMFTIRFKMFLKEN